MVKKEGSAAAGDAPQNKDEKGKAGAKTKEPEVVEEILKTPSQLALEEAECRAEMRRQRFKRKWPEVTKVDIKTRKWRPPPPPKKLPRLFIDLPEVTTRKWVPPYRRRHKLRPKLQRIPAEEMTQPLYDFKKLRRIWHSFAQVDRNKMMVQGFSGCNSKKYSSTACGSQTGAIAVMCKALLEEKPPARLVRADVDDVIDQGDKYYRQCMLALKCYKGKPSLTLSQLLTSFFFHDTKYTVKLVEVEKGLLAKHPDNIQNEPDLMSLMEKRSGSTYNLILTVGDMHFLIWGHPPSPESGSQVKTVCYIFDPHMLNDQGQPHKLFGGGAFLRYPGINSFVLDFLSNYGDLDSAKRGTPKPPIALTEIDLSDQKEVKIWTSMDEVTSMVVYDEEYEKYVGVFNHNTIKLWDEDAETLDGHKKYKFALNILRLVRREGKPTLVVFENGNCVSLSYGIENRKCLDGKSLLKSTDDIVDIGHYTSEGVDYVCYVVNNSLHSKYDIVTCPLRPELCDLEKMNLNKIKMKRRNSDVYVAGKLISTDERPVVYVLWSDCRMSAYDLVTKSWRTIGRVPWVMTSPSVSLAWMGEHHLLLFGNDAADDGATLVGYNVQLGVLSCRYPMKLYCDGAKLYCFQNVMVLEAGNHVGLLPYVLEVNRSMATLLGSHENVEEEPTVMADWGFGELSLSVCDDIKELLKNGMRERAICAKIVPQFLEKKDFKNLQIVMTQFQDVPENVMVTLLKFIVGNLEDLGASSDDMDAFVKRNEEKLTFLNDVFRIPYCSAMFIPCLRDTLKLDHAVFLLNYITHLLVTPDVDFDANYESVLFDWCALLLDAFYQQNIMSTDESVTRALNNMSAVVDKLVKIMDQIEGVVPLIEKLIWKRNKMNKFYSDKKKYTIELMYI